MINIRECDIDNLEKAAKIAFKMNNKVENYICYCGMNYESIYKEFKYSMEENIHRVLLIYSDDILCGVCSIYCIEDINRVDLGGPFIDYDLLVGFDDKQYVFIEAGKKIIEYARNTYKNHNIHINFGSFNSDYMELVNVLGAEKEAFEEIHRITRDDFVPVKVDESILKYTDKYKNQIVNIKESVFGDIYMSSDELINTIGKNREVYLTKANEKVIAVGVLEWFEGDRTEAFIELVGVDEEYRKKGYGKSMVNKLLSRAFENSSVSRVELCVDDDNYNAIKLYESVGFKCVRKNCSYVIKL